MTFLKKIQKNRRMIKLNSIMVRKSLGLQVRVSETLIELNKQLQSNELFYLQHKTDVELNLMNFKKWGKLRILLLTPHEPQIRRLIT